MSFYNLITGESFRSFLSIFILVFSVVCWYRIFEKCNEKGWYAIIPIFNRYIIFKLFLSTRLFFIRLIIAIVNFVSIMYLFANFIMDSISVAGSLENITQETLVEVSIGIYTKYPIIILIMLVCLIALMIIDIMVKYYILKGFNKSAWWIILYIALEMFIDAYLAFSNEVYTGNKYLKNNNVNTDYNTSEYNE